MQESALITLSATLVCLLIIGRQGRLGSDFIRLALLICLWVAVQLLGGFWLPRGLPLWAELTGHLFVWIAGLGIILPGSRGSWIPALALIFISLVAFLPEIAVTMLRWGTVTAVPLLALWSARVAGAGTDGVDGRESPGAAGFGESWNGHGQIVPRSILEFLGEGLIVADTGGRINYANEKAAALLGLPAVEIYGQSIVSVLSRLPMMGAGEHNTPSRFEMNGRQIEGRIELIHSLAGELEGTLAVLDDITEAYQLERTRRAMLTAVSHELRSPLTAIKGYVDLLASNLSGDLNHTQRSHLGTIERNVSRMVHLINRLIFMAAGQEDHPEENKIITDLEQVIPQTLQELVPVAERQGIQITTRLADNLRPIQVVPRHFGTILRELVANGIKFSEAGGSIQITAELQEGQAPEDAFVVVQVQDTGIGIEPEDQRHIFDEFVQIDASTDAVKKRAGMGVGLAIVRALIEAYSGRIWLESESGQGSQFTFILPVVQQKEMVVALPAIG